MRKISSESGIVPTTPLTLAVTGLLFDLLGFLKWWKRNGSRFDPLFIEYVQKKIQDVLTRHPEFSASIFYPFIANSSIGEPRSFAVPEDSLVAITQID